MKGFCGWCRGLDELGIQSVESCAVEMLLFHAVCSQHQHQNVHAVREDMRRSCRWGQWQGMVWNWKSTALREDRAGGDRGEERFGMVLERRP